ncbi:MAG: nucleotide exchange factor GrpE, partial [Candidatus Omnitrophica bacterium]|nr:nucleotide exchange factor GrpE [Candidatus Omnitrophota bacterium]
MSPPLLGPDGRPLGPEPTAPAPVVTVEQYEALRRQAAQADDYKDRWLRLQAEFENSRKRWGREQQDLEERAGERLLAAFLEIVDDFERAVAATAGDTDPAHVRAGLTMIHRRLLDFLKALGVEPMETAGQPFDPARHEAAAQV